MPTRPWAAGSDSISVVGAFRFDDPAGAVGMETFLIASAGRVLQVPITYRGAPPTGAENALVTTMEHSVLGRRWAYDGAADPVYVHALATAILTGGTQADIEYDYEAPPEKLIVTTHVTGTGTAGAEIPAIDSVSFSDSSESTVITAGGTRIELVRVVDTARSSAAAPALTGTWPGQPEPAVLAWTSPTRN